MMASVDTDEHNDADASASTSHFAGAAVANSFSQLATGSAAENALKPDMGSASNYMFRVRP